MRPYTQMKNTPLTWIGDIPSHWKLTKTKILFKAVSGSTPSSSVDEYWDGDIDWITPGDLSQLNSRYVEFSARRITKFGLDSCGSELVPRGSIILSTRAPIGSLAITVKRMCTNQGCKALIPAKAHSAYAYYFFSISTEQLNLRGKGTTFLELSTDELKSFPFPAPPFVEQQKIAQFLDYETAKIDALIDEQKRLIELLKEKRQAVISHAVTKGLNPDAPMKDSGVEWLGEVPEHWRVSPLRYATEFQEGPGILAKDFKDDGVPLIRISGVQGNEVTTSGCNFLDPELVSKKWKHFRLSKGDLVISGSASMELVSEVTKETQGSILYTGLIRINSVNRVTQKSFIKVFLASKMFFTQIDMLKAGSTIQHFGPSHLNQMRIVIPPLHEQQEIADYVNHQTQRFESLIKQAQRQTKLLKERRSALISAAVTGKIDVRDWQPPAGSDTVDSNASMQTERHYG